MKTRKSELVTYCFTVIDADCVPQAGLSHGLHWERVRTIIHEIFPLTGIDSPGKVFFRESASDYALENVN